MWKPRKLYSQNFEDLYLYRFFCGVDKGFYIDVGAWHPTHYSVTAIFYEQGWRGINIEPVTEIFEILQEQRSDDINLCLAVVGSSDSTTVPMLVVGDNPSQWGHHSVINLPAGEQASSPECSPPISTRMVPASTLREIIDKYAILQPISFLKLDIAGSEYQALLGLDLSTLRPESRPQVVLLEATIPNTRLSSPCRPQCRANLEANGYRHLYFDGLNDYYCESELYDVFVPLMLPPNVFDSPCIVASRLFVGIDEPYRAFNENPDSCTRASDPENQLSLQEDLLGEAQVANAHLTGSSMKLQADLDCLFKERQSIAAKLKILRLATQSRPTSPLLSHERGFVSFPPSPKGFGARTAGNEATGYFKLAVYIHIPKCSGTSLLTPYLYGFGDRVKWVGINSTLEDVQQGIPRDFPYPSAIYAGHFGVRDIETHLDMFPGCDIKYFAHFRDPMHRAISYYDYIGRTERDPRFHLLTNFSDDLEGWYGDLLLSEPQVQFISPSLSSGPEDVAALMAFIRSGKLRLFDNHNVLGCASEVNMHADLVFPRSSHSKILNNDTSAVEEASLSGLPYISSLPLLKQLCQADINFWELVKSQGILS